MYLYRIYLSLFQGSDVTTYDDVVEGIEPEESSGLHIPIAEVKY